MMLTSPERTRSHQYITPLTLETDMPKKITPAQDQDNGIELTSMDVTSSNTKQDTHDDSEDEWELISPVSSSMASACQP